MSALKGDFILHRFKKLFFFFSGLFGLALIALCGSLLFDGSFNSKTLTAKTNDIRPVVSKLKTRSSVFKESVKSNSKDRSFFPYETIRVSSENEYWIKVIKKERKLELMRGGKVVSTYPVSLGFNPVDDKIKEGDGCTPEGLFYICEYLKNPSPVQSYGARSLRLSYPSKEDARRGLADNLIKRIEYIKIIRACEKYEMPPQTTILGSSLRIHGGGINSDWTLGCIALKDEHITEIFDKIPSEKAVVLIFNNRAQEREFTKPINLRIVQACEILTKKGCDYTQSASGYIGMSYPNGDIPENTGVCSDLVVRALRFVNIDLQACLHEDVILFPQDYPMIKIPDKNIDHRRVKSLQPFFEKYFKKLSIKNPSLAPEEWRSGDIVIFETGINNSTPYDHIGIVGEQENGRYLVYNLWTFGYSLKKMDLLYGDFPKITGHYRVAHLGF